MIEKITSENPIAQSAPIIPENIARLKELFPEAFSEGKVNFETLQDLLGNYVDNGEEKFGLNWSGKRRARQVALTPSNKTLRPAKDESKDWNTTENLYIEGDNLEVLKLLQKAYANSIKMIYIDPPYNTGKDFVYSDKFAMMSKEALIAEGFLDEGGEKLKSTDVYDVNAKNSARYHTNWLNMMYPRLRLARNLLKEDGVIFISIDDTEVANLRKICDEIFGEENFVGTVIWETATDNNPSQIATEHEYIHCYTKNLASQNNWEIKSDKASIIINEYLKLKDLCTSPTEIQTKLRKWINANKKSNDCDLSGFSHYNYVDEIGVFYPGNPANTKPGGYQQDIPHPVTGRICAKPENGYRWPEVTFQQADKVGDVLWGEDETVIPKIKKRIETASEMFKSYFYQDNRISTNGSRSLFNGKKIFDNPKSLALLQKTINFTTKPTDIILDFFSGSATTAHAVMQLNAEDQGNRKFIMVQLPEACDEKTEAFKAGYKNICEIGKERIRRAGEKIKTDNAGKEGIDSLDIGFKVFKLDSSNIKEWQSDTDDLLAQLDAHQEHLLDGRSDEDILFELMLKLNIRVTELVEEKTIAAKTVYCVAGGKLFVCLAESIGTNQVDELANGIINWRAETGYIAGSDTETTFVFRDSAFASNEVKSNLSAIFEQAGFTNLRSL